MISARMSRLLKPLATSCAVFTVAVLAGACGTENISVPKSSGALYTGAVLFNQRCAGCHTLGEAATRGSAANVRSSEFNNGPNFDIRCERPVARVMYAIQNGGFSGAIMPQNIVVGQQAINVARFVATYAGSKAPKLPGSVQCQSEPIGTIPAFVKAAATTPTSTTTPAKTSTSSTKTTGKSKAKGSAKP
jgi:mono/diheme cytochrome c family protein